MKLGMKSIISVILTIVFMLTCFAPVITTAQSFGSFTLEIQSEESGLNLSNIKVDVYESTLDRYEPSIGAYDLAPDRCANFKVSNSIN